MRERHRQRARLRRASDSSAKPRRAGSVRKEDLIVVGIDAHLVITALSRAQCFCVRSLDDANRRSLLVELLRGTEM